MDGAGSLFSDSAYSLHALTALEGSAEILPAHAEGVGDDLAGVAADRHGGSSGDPWPSPPAGRELAPEPSWATATPAVPAVIAPAIATVATIFFIGTFISDPS